MPPCPTTCRRWEYRITVSSFYVCALVVNTRYCATYEALGSDDHKAKIVSTSEAFTARDSPVTGSALVLSFL